jgi:NAD(P)H-dependent flavin oxidoreductase YrpB (nitropropane dioxygenase family)
MAFMPAPKHPLFIAVSKGFEFSLKWVIMHANNVPALNIGDLHINPPIIQGGMGVKVSGANLAAAVADTGCAGIISSAGLGQFEDCPRGDLLGQAVESLRQEIRKARAMSDGIIGVNIMHVLSHYAQLAKASVEENVDLIISGAGLPLDLPGFLDGKNIKLVPIVSSARTFKIICKRWNLHYNKLPDAVVVEGPKAGGHLGYTSESLLDNTAPNLDEIVTEVLDVANSFPKKIPVIAAGGIFDGWDIAHYLRLGAAGVQMATRFVCTDECDVDINFKKAYLNAHSEDDITIIKSPVGLPGRVIKSEFVEKVKRGETIPFKCSYKCLKTCDPTTAPYCIAKVLANAARGQLDKGFAFAGSNAYLCDKIVPVKSLVQELTEQLEEALTNPVKDKCSIK